MQVTINVPKNIINNIKQAAEVYAGATPTNAQIQEFLSGVPGMACAGHLH